jgi:hypothetical protein
MRTLILLSCVAVSAMFARLTTAQAAPPASGPRVTHELFNPGPIDSFHIPPLEHPADEAPSDTRTLTMPEPGTLALMASGALLVATRRWRHSRRGL